ncbi:hypothetical protein Pmar_PMAR001181 [Perkinsus marinus ATCC 50983]|uniref:Uncharacterized protein n=1 Tax=Perkinsus marinus (strain ATCC 50983 / TXsc) TaxID=423536 RepID=C5KT32_PERM5|nr:hypothetical protein Pmar_PMAR001181 [Perkinsus marinus ATCC 50983]EER12382.1 hypothetical protein Pmar_PMAR001181 [Perkinsus marinus ATCC 50983]|eukprot:XP_002780587.1 hypothetical protein Pmar_PMAR001181 [Perkinsus marinus ATCC 50983]
MVPSYRHGVLINNYSEDLFGVDLYKKRLSGQLVEDPQVIAARQCSMSHWAHRWQPIEPHSSVPDAQTAEAQDRRLCVPQHLLFGHAGDVNKDPRRNLQRREFYTSHQFFYQNPDTGGKIKQVHRKPSELFQANPENLGEHAPVLTSLVERSRSRWAEEVAEERFATTNSLSYRGANSSASEGTSRHPKKTGEFTATVRKNYHKIGLREAGAAG